jgi:sortase (surface protein transpeptidase)
MITQWTRPGWLIRLTGAVLATLVAGVCLGGCGSAGSPTASGTPQATRQATAGPSLPSWIDIPSIGAKSTLVPLGLNANESIQVPPVDMPQQAGWYKYSPPPGQVGPAVILGHIDGDHQQGIFWRLHDVKPGAKVSIGRQDGTTVTFVVNKVDQVHKSTFPTSAVYGNTADPELRLITCGGAFDATTGHYLDNVIVYATMTG